MITTITFNADGSALWSTDWEALIKQEIEQKLDHEHVAQTYSYLIRSGYRQWVTLNPLIIKAYGKRGFMRIKGLAWERIDADKKRGGVTMAHWIDNPNPEFERWWATKVAEGYQYGREALENVRFGFEGAQEVCWQPIETAPKDGTRILLVRENYVWVDDWWKGDGTNGNWSVLVAWLQATGKLPDSPTHWMPLPKPPKE